MTDPTKKSKPRVAKPVPIADLERELAEKNAQRGQAQKIGDFLGFPVTANGEQMLLMQGAGKITFMAEDAADFAQIKRRLADAASHPLKLSGAA